MANYGPLGRHLENQAKTEILLDFNEIEVILSYRLPPSARTH
jgi:hypothetical protein